MRFGNVEDIDAIGENRSQVVKSPLTVGSTEAWFSPLSPPLIEIDELALLPSILQGG
jgi:hypothetical protein